MSSEATGDARPKHSTGTLVSSPMAPAVVASPAWTSVLTAGSATSGPRRFRATSTTATADHRAPVHRLPDALAGPTGGEGSRGASRPGQERRPGQEQVVLYTYSCTSGVAWFCGVAKTKGAVCSRGTFLPLLASTALWTPVCPSP